MNESKREGNFMSKPASRGLSWQALVLAGLFGVSAAYGEDKAAAPSGPAPVKQSLTLQGRDLKIENKQVRDGVTMMDEIARCASLSKTSGEFVTCLHHLTGAWKKQGLMTGEERNRLMSAASRTSNPTAIATAHTLSKAVVASAF